MDQSLAELVRHLAESLEHLIWPKSPPRLPQNGLCKAVLPPSPVFKI